MFWLVLFLFILILGGGFLAFLTLEFIALRNSTDQIYTFSTYLKRWRRKHRIVGALLYSLIILGAATYLEGHLVFELW